jgi:thymidylate synthase
MNRNYTFTDITSALPALLGDLASAPVVGSRAGRTRELTHVGITIEEPWRREVLVPERKCNIAAQIAETAWVLAGRNDISWLSYYLPRAGDFSDNKVTWRSGYGPRLRDWHGVDQLAEVVNLLRNDPETRRAVAVLWDPVTDLQPGKDIACNNWLSFLVRDRALDLHVAVRSNDAMWGWSGINCFEWSALQEIVAGLVGVAVGQLHFSVTSFHLYERHWEKADRIVLECAMTQRVEVELSPQFEWSRESPFGELDTLLDRWFEIEHDIRTHNPRAQGYTDAFPEPMLRSWLRVLDWWWNGKVASPTHLDHTALGAACRMGVTPPWEAKKSEGPTCNECGTPGMVKDGDQNYCLKCGNRRVTPKPMSLFLDHAIRVHNEKHAAYGDSWKRRGEMLGIMANIARKIDRLGGSETADETSADTALDLMVYLAKYQVWLDAHANGTPHDVDPSDSPSAANELLVLGEEEVSWSRIGLDDSPSVVGSFEANLRVNFDLLEKQVMSGDPQRSARVQVMLRDAYVLARYRYESLYHDEYQGADHD